MTADLTVVAIDGPAGSGKSTVARKLAEELELEYLDTGAMYRSVTFAVLARGVDPDDEDRVAQLAQEVSIELAPDGTVVVDGVDATTQIRGPEVSRSVSAVAANQAVRVEMVSQQREWTRRRGGGVLEGRDIGTVVFPDAALKVYLTADPEVRAARRAREVTDLDYDSVAADLARRDSYDSGRQHDPLRQADDAVTLDTTGMTIDEVVADLVARVKAAGGGNDVPGGDNAGLDAVGNGG
jgi:cytidylate kinase